MRVITGKARGKKLREPDDYSIRFYFCDDGYHIVGLLVDREEKVVAEL